MYCSLKIVLMAMKFLQICRDPLDLPPSRINLTTFKGMIPEWAAHWSKAGPACPIIGSGCLFSIMQRIFSFSISHSSFKYPWHSFRIADRNRAYINLEKLPPPLCNIMKYTFVNLLQHTMTFYISLPGTSSQRLNSD